jgi:hypothetical protein
MPFSGIEYYWSAYIKIGTISISVSKSIVIICSKNKHLLLIAWRMLLYFFYFLWPQAGSLNPLPEVFTVCGEGGGVRTRISKAIGAATLPMSYSRPLNELFPPSYTLLQVLVQGLSNVTLITRSEIQNKSTTIYNLFCRMDMLGAGGLGHTSLHELGLEAGHHHHTHHHAPHHHHEQLHPHQPLPPHRPLSPLHPVHSVDSSFSPSSHLPSSTVKIKPGKHSHYRKF